MIPDETLIKLPDRSGIITGIGIFLGFLLNFIAYWAFTWSIKESSIPGSTGTGRETLIGWRIWDAPVIVLLLLGVILITVALYRVLIPYNQPLRRYEGSIKFFVFGVIVSMVGVALSIIFTHPFFFRR
jgi:hypothetical protein